MNAVRHIEAVRRSFDRWRLVHACRHIFLLERSFSGRLGNNVGTARRVKGRNREKPRSTELEIISVATALALSFYQKLESESRLEFEELHRGFVGLRALSLDLEAERFGGLKGSLGWPFVDACPRCLAATGH